jgi:hypothetical protein
MALKIPKFPQGNAAGELGGRSRSAADSLEGN